MAVHARFFMVCAPLKLLFAWQDRLYLCICANTSVYVCGRGMRRCSSVIRPESSARSLCGKTAASGPLCRNAGKIPTPPRVSVRGAMRRSIHPGRGPAHTGSWPPGAGPARPSALPPRDNASGPAGQGRSGQGVRHGPPHGRAPDKPWGRAPTSRFPPAAGSCPCVRAASSNLPFPVIINKNLPKRKASAGVRQGRIRVTGRDSSRSRRRACRSPREERCTSRS